MLLLRKTGSELLLLIMPLAQVAASDEISSGLDRQPAIRPLAPPHQQFY